MMDSEDFNNNHDHSASEQQPSKGGVRLKERVNQQAHDIGEKLNTSAEQAKQKATDVLVSTSMKMHDVSEQIDENAVKLGKNVSNTIRATSDKIDDVASYLDSKDTRSLFSGVKSLVGQHPGKSMAIALVIGVWMGKRLLR